MSWKSGTFGRKSEENKVKIEDAIASNDWNSRKLGYVAAAANFRKPDLRGKNWDLFNNLARTLTTERNVPALEKGLEAVWVFFENCSIVDDDVVQSVLNDVVKKALSYVNPRIKELANRICMALFNRKKHEMVTDMLLQGMESRNIKVAFSCIRTLTNALSEYGPSYVNTSAAASSAVALCQNKAMFQQDVKDLLREIYKWNGPDGMEHYMKSLDASQYKAMKIEFSKVDEDRAERSRFVHNSPMGVESFDMSWASTTGRRAKSARPSLTVPKTPLKSIRPASTSQANKNFTVRMSSTSSRQSHSSTSSKKVSARACGDRPIRRNQPCAATKMEMDDIFIMMENKQWGERKEAVDELYNRINSDTTINATDYSKIIQRLRVLILEDTNVVLVAKAIKCVAAFAQNHNKEFQQHAPLMMTLLLEKFKDKKTIIIDSTREAIDAIYLNYHYGSIARYVALSLVSPNPSVKAETAFFVQRCFTRPTTTLLKPSNWKPLVQGLVNNLTFPDQNVREHALKALGTIMKNLGKEPLVPYMTKLPKHQTSLIFKYCNDTEVAYIRPSSHAGTDASLDVGSVSEDLESTSTTDEELRRPKANSLLPGFKAQTLPIQRKEGLHNPLFQASQKGGHQDQARSESNCSSDEPDDTLPRNTHRRNSRCDENQNHVTNIPNHTNSGRQSLSPAARQKLATFRCVIKQLKEAWRNVQPQQGSQPQELMPDLLADGLGTTEEKITRKLQDLEGSVSRCFTEIRQLSPQLYKELEYLSNQSSGDVIRSLNQKLNEMERLLKSMAFEMSSLGTSTV